MTRWRPPASWHVYPVPGGYREYRHGLLGYSWAVVTAGRMARLRPDLRGRGLPDPMLGGVIPDEPPAFYAVRLDCRGRLDRAVGSAATAERAQDACADDAGRVAELEAERFERTGSRPAWPLALPGLDGRKPPAVMRRDLLSWRLRRLAGMTARTRKARIPAEPLRAARQG